MSAEETAHSESCMQDAHAAGDLNSTGESSGIYVNFNFFGFGMSRANKGTRESLLNIVHFSMVRYNLGNSL